MLIAGPMAVALVAGYAYVTGGQTVSTDNAYVKADKVTIVPEVAGRIVAVDVRENQRIAAGTKLFRIDDRPYRIALKQAEAELASARDEIAELKATYRQKAEELALVKTNVDFAKREFERKSALIKSQVVTAQKLDAAKNDLDVARRRVRVVTQDLAQTRARLQGDPNIMTEDHPLYRQAAARCDQAKLDLERTVVRAPFDGVAGHVPQMDEQVEPGQAAMSVVSDSNIWINANFKETDLTYMHPGQKVAIRVDTYPDREWTGAVDSISPSTGAEFSVIPAQNATGNWVKVVQRIPVRIAVEDLHGEHRLRAGMSATVEIETGHRRTLPSPVKSALAALNGVLPANSVETEYSR